MKRKFMKLAQICFAVTLLFSPNIVHATENNNVVEDSIEKKNKSVIINYILEGVNTTLKSSKTLKDSDDFWDDYTIKLTNKLSNGNIDIQEKIRDYYFSHYEINGRRIESIDAIIHLTEEDTEINVIYCEEKQQDGYLRKGFAEGIAIDFPYLEYVANKKTQISSELYDETWSIDLPYDYCLEIENKNNSLVNANDKTLYFNIITNPLSIKEETDLTKKYNYIDSIKVNSSLAYSDIKAPFTLKYKPIDTITNLKDKELILNGVNLEGKIEEITTSIFKEDCICFNIEKNLNNYQYIFVSLKSSYELVEELTDATNKTEIKEDISTIFDQNKLTINNQTHSTITKNEPFVIKIILFSFITGSISTYLLSLILSTRQANIEKKKKDSQV